MNGRFDRISAYAYETLLVVLLAVFTPGSANKGEITHEITDRCDQRLALHYRY
jgi:hypothetical protein